MNSIANPLKNKKRLYVWGGPAGLLYDVSIPANSTAETARYYHSDQVGSTMALTNQSGTVIGRADYTPYGLITLRSGDTNTPFLYNGAFGVMTDSETGLVHMRARYYHPWLARFINADPIGFEGGMNMYAFANGNPIMRIDPSGNIVETAWDLANLGMGGYSLWGNVRDGNYGWAALDALGLVYDGAATAVPFLPAGASAGLKAARAGNTVVHSVNAGLDVARVSNNVHDAAKVIDAGTMTGKQAASAGTQLHRQVAVQTSDVLGHFDSSFMAGANGASGKMPDMIGAGVWADITTPGQWQKHVNSYSSGFGDGIPILYQRGVGVVGTTRLASGAGLGLSALQGASGNGGAFSGLGGGNSRK